jgi:hypothetical protein
MRERQNGYKLQKQKQKQKQKAKICKIIKAPRSCQDLSKIGGGHKTQNHEAEPPQSTVFLACCVFVCCLLYCTLLLVWLF